MSGLNAIATPSPYQNLTSAYQSEDENADDLKQGVADAQARFDAASKQYNARPGAQESDIYNKAYQDLVDRTNRLGHVSTKARELELQQKMGGKVPTRNFVDPSGNPGIEFNHGLEMQATPKATPTSQVDLESLLRMSGNAPASVGGENPSVARDPASIGQAYSGPNKVGPPVKPTSGDLIQQAIDTNHALRSGGMGAIGDKAKVTGNYKEVVSDTKPNLLPAAAIDPQDSFIAAVRNTPEWKDQASGLEDLNNLVQLQAQRNAKKSNVDLSPLAAYLDYSNALHGMPTKLASEFKGEPIEDTTLKDMGDIQRRKNDLSKDLINTIKASKFGMYTNTATSNLGVDSGLNVPKPSNPFGQAHLSLSAVQDLKKATDQGYKDNDEQLKAINTISQRVANSAKNPAESGSLPALLEVMDTGSKRILAGVLGMEGYDPSIPGQLKAGFAKATQGMIPADQRAFLQDRLQKAAQRATDQRNAIHADLTNYAGSLPVTQRDIKNIVDSHHNMGAKAFPSATKAGEGGSAATTSPANEQNDFNNFMQMMKAHEAGK